jgi:hypothetical protein
MKKFVVLSLALVLVIAAGCATTSKSISDEEQIKKQMEEGIANIKAKNYDAFEKTISESFYAGVVGDKKDLLAYLKNADDMGFLDDIEIDVSEAEIVIEGDKGTVSPVYADGGFGSLGLTFEGAKENGVWMITGLVPY